MATISSMNVRMGLNAGGFFSGMQRAQGQVRQFGAQSQRATGQYQRFTRSIGNTGALRSMGNAFRNVLGTLGLGLGFAVLVSKLREATRGAMAFGKAMAEVATLGVKNIGQLTNAVRDVSARYALGTLDVAKAAYQAISAGATEFQAPRVLEKAAIAATAGVTDLTTAVTLGMAAMNAYGKSIDSIGDAFDEAFLAVKYGVTTFEELAASAPQIFPLASAMDIPSQDVFAAVAALTKGGFSTGEAVTGLQGILVAVAKETSKAKNAAKELGLEFSVQAMKAKGLQQFLGELGTATDGDAAKMNKLMRRVEGTSAALALTGSQAGFLNDMFVEMENKTGKAQDAFDLMVKNNPARALELTQAKIEDLSLSLGNKLVPLTFLYAKALIRAEQAWKQFSITINKPQSWAQNGIEWLFGKLGDLAAWGKEHGFEPPYSEEWFRTAQEAMGEQTDFYTEATKASQKRIDELENEIGEIDKLSGAYDEAMAQQAQARANIAAGGGIPKNQVDSEALLDRIRNEGAIEELDSPDSMVDNLDKIKMAEHLRESVMTPIEQYNKAISELNSIADYLSPETYSRALGKIQEDFLKASGAVDDYGNRLEDVQRTIDQSRGIQMDARDVAFNGPMPTIDVSGAGQKSSDERTHQLLQQLLQYMRRDGVAPVAV